MYSEASAKVSEIGSSLRPGELHFSSKMLSLALLFSFKSVMFTTHCIKSGILNRPIKPLALHNNKVTLLLSNLFFCRYILRTYGTRFSGISNKGKFQNSQFKHKLIYFSIFSIHVCNPDDSPNISIQKLSISLP